VSTGGTTNDQDLVAVEAPLTIEIQADGAEPVPLEEVVGKRRIVPLDHPWIESARRVGTCLGV